jgi:hypothetical protein
MGGAETPRYSLEQLREIVAAGLSIGEAKQLLDEGYDPAGVLELAQLKAQATLQAAADAQTATAKAMQKAMRPENTEHPGISVFSYPEGDKAHPKAPLPFEVYFDNYPCHKWPETEHWREWELMAQLEPGEFKVLRKDFQPMKVTVRGERNMDGKLSKVFVELPREKDERKQVPPKIVLLEQLVRHAENPRVVFMEATQSYLRLLFGEPEAAAV